MKIKEVLQRLRPYGIEVGRDTVESDGTRVIIFGSPLPSFPYGPGRFCYYTLVLSPDEDEVPLEERDTIRRRLYHLTQDIFGDDEKEWPDLFPQDK